MTDDERMEKARVAAKAAVDQLGQACLDSLVQHGQLAATYGAPPWGLITNVAMSALKTIAEQAPAQRRALTGGNHDLERRLDAIIAAVQAFDAADKAGILVAQTLPKPPRGQG